MVLFPTHDSISRNGHADLLHPQPIEDGNVEILIAASRSFARRLLQIIVEALVQHHHSVRHVHQRPLQLGYARHQVGVHHSSPRHHRFEHLEIGAFVEDPAVLRSSEARFPTELQRSRKRRREAARSV